MHSLLTVPKYYYTKEIVGTIEDIPLRSDLGSVLFWGFSTYNTCSIDGSINHEMSNAGLNDAIRKDPTIDERSPSEIGHDLPPSTQHIDPLLERISTPAAVFKEMQSKYLSIEFMLGKGGPIEYIRSKAGPVKR